MFNRLFSWFENRVDPYPASEPKTPRNGLFGFIWSNLEGVRGWLVLLALLSGGIGIGEALLFQFIGKIVDWLGRYTPETLFAEKGLALVGMGVLMVVLVIWTFFTSSIRLQVLQGVFPMRLRWNFHRLMLGQSLSFYQDEFAGRVSAKVMQTALAVRDTVMTIADMVMYVLVYFITSGVILVALDSWLLLPFVGWLIGFSLVMRFLIPRLGQTAARQADRPRYRCLRQHRHGEALLPRCARSRLCPPFDGGIYGNRARPNAAGHAALQCQRRSKHRAHPFHRRARHLAVAPRPGGCGRSGHRHRDGATRERALAIHHVGIRPPV